MAKGELAAHAAGGQGRRRRRGHYYDRSAELLRRTAWPRMAEARELAAGRKAEYERRRALRREREQAEKFRERKAAEKIRRVCGVEQSLPLSAIDLDKETRADMRYLGQSPGRFSLD